MFINQSNIIFCSFSFIDCTLFIYSKLFENNKLQISEKRSVNFWAFWLSDFSIIDGWISHFSNIFTRFPKCFVWFSWQDGQSFLCQKTRFPLSLLIVAGELVLCRLNGCYVQNFSQEFICWHFLKQYLSQALDFWVQPYLATHHCSQSFPKYHFRSLWLSGLRSGSSFSTTCYISVRSSPSSLQSPNITFQPLSCPVLPFILPFSFLTLLYSIPSIVSLRFLRFSIWLALVASTFGSASSFINLSFPTLLIATLTCPICSRILLPLPAYRFLALFFRILLWASSLFTCFYSIPIWPSPKIPFQNLRFLGSFANYEPEFSSSALQQLTFLT